MEALARFIQILAYVLTAAIFIRVIASWIAIDPRNPFMTIIYDVTEPILAPLRQIIPRFGMFDLSPMVATFILIAIANAVPVLLT